MKPAGSACETCPARLGKCVAPEPAHGKARLAIVGEGPGATELEEGRPFVGASGRMLMRGLRTLGLKRGDVHWTNAVLCECDDKALPKARKQCAQRLRDELAASGAPVVMPVGAFGLQSTLQLPKRPQIQKWRGSVSETTFTTPTTSLRPERAPGMQSGGEIPGLVGESGGRDGVARLEFPGPAPAFVSLVAPTIHPAFVMRSPAWGPVLEVDFERVGRLLDGVAAGVRWLPPESRDGRRIVVARDLDGLADYLSQLDGEDEGYDVETVGLGPTRTRLVSFAFSDGRLTVVVPWSRGRDGVEPFWRRPDDVARLVTWHLRSKRAITHNGPAFDHIVSQRYGINITRWGDTLLAAHATASHLPKRLQHVVTMGLDVGPWKELEDRTATIERLWIYNGRDTLYTVLRWAQLRDEVAPLRETRWAA